MQEEPYRCVAICSHVIFISFIYNYTLYTATTCLVECIVTVIKNGTV